jgi:hypothetical protein
MQSPPLAETALGRCRSRAILLSASIATKNEDKMKRTGMILALLFLAPLVRAQAVPAETQSPVSAALREILPGRQKNTVAAVEAMPADKFNYKPSGDQRTFGQLVDHIVETNYLLCGKAAALPARTFEGTKDTDSKDKRVTALKASFDFFLRSVGEKGRFETSGDHGRIRGKTSHARLDQSRPGWYLGRPLRRSRNVSTPERCIAAHRQEIRAGNMCDEMAGQS